MDEQVNAQEIVAKANEQLVEQIFVINRQPKLVANDNDVELNDGYTYYVNSPIPELADAIAKFAKELPNLSLIRDLVKEATSILFN